MPYILRSIFSICPPDCPNRLSHVPTSCPQTKTLDFSTHLASQTGRSLEMRGPPHRPAAGLQPPATRLKEWLNLEESLYKKGCLLWLVVSLFRNRTPQKGAGFPLKPQRIGTLKSGTLQSFGSAGCAAGGRGTDKLCSTAPTPRSLL